MSAPLALAFSSHTTHPCPLVSLVRPRPPFSYLSTFLAIGSSLFPFQTNSRLPLHQHNVHGSPKSDNRRITSRWLQPHKARAAQVPRHLGDICVVSRTAPRMFSTRFVLVPFRCSSRHTSSLKCFHYYWATQHRLSPVHPCAQRRPLHNHSIRLVDIAFLVMTPCGLSPADMTR